MRKYILLSLLTSLSAWACPELQGTFHCRGSQPFDVSVQNNLGFGSATYTLSDATGTHTIVADGGSREMQLSQGTGQYAAMCDGRSLLVEIRAPNGAVVHDRYYIERSALVRVRLARGNHQPEVLSCAPTNGTWRYYQR